MNAYNGSLMRFLAFFTIMLLAALSADASAQQCQCRMKAAGGQQGGGAFALKPENTSDCRQSDVVDVNLGNSPTEAVRRLYCQITGKEPPASASAFSQPLSSDARARRIDVAYRICAEEGKQCKFAFSSPWENNVEPSAPACERIGKRDVGAVLMFFFDCPGKTNCEMNWAGNHVFGMDPVAPMAGGGYYDPDEVAFWTRELRDARYAGLQFLLPNVYGPDMVDEGKIDKLAQALKSEGDAVKIGMLDDTWTWGQTYFGAKWAAVPNLSDTEGAASTMYQMKWKPFFTKIDDAHRYKIDGKPVIYFYNAGTLSPRNVSAAVIKRMKEMFKADFGSEPFVVVDTAFFDDPAMESVANGRFTWNSISPAAPGGVNGFAMNGKKLGNAMVRWDAVGRESPGQPAKDGDTLIKGDELLNTVLNGTTDFDVLTLATWNDLGEGTGINRAYDYYYKGKWLEPDHFMRLIRKSQCANADVAP
ncbi:MAG: DUF5010 domain-containing protein [Rickettsiales bacterium]